MKSIIRVFSFIILGSFLFVACNNQNLIQKNDVITIDLEAMVDQNQAIGLDEIAQEVRYIPLETLPEAMLNPTKLLYVNKRIFVLNRTVEIFLFNDEGKFIRQIGTIGPGPEEYLGALGGPHGMEVSPDGAYIYYYSTRGNIAYTYNIEGEKVNSFSLKYLSWRYAPLSEGRHIMISPYGSFSPDSVDFLFYLQDGSGKVVRKYPSSQVIKMMGDFSIGVFSTDPKRVLAYQPFCDTVFQVDGDGEMNPAFYLNFGDHRAPDELYADMANIMSPKESYFLSPKLHQTKDKLFIRIRELKKYHVGIYQFDDGNIYSIKTDNTKIPNDLDGGPDFWPSGTDGEQHLYRMLQPFNMLNPDEEKLRNKPEVKDKDAAEAYQRLLSTLNENDNPVVMVIKLK